MLVAAPAFKTSDYRAMVEEVRARAARRSSASSSSTSADWDELLAGAARSPASELGARARRPQSDDPINIQYTSGTTGLPQGRDAHRTATSSTTATSSARAARYTEEDRVCIPVPFYHCFGMVMGNLGCTTHGATMVIPAPAFEPERDARGGRAQERCTALYGVPTMFIAELDHPRFADYDLVVAAHRDHGRLAVPGRGHEAACIDHMHMAEVTICYGMTETSPVSTQTAADDPLEQRVGTVGRVHPHVEVKIVDPETGATVGPRGEPGELCTRGYCVMLGYWNDPERTAEAIDADGWMHTGDLATMDDEGYVNIVGRIKDMIIRGGENVYPREVEEFLYTHPDVADVQVIGVPDAALRRGADGLDHAARRARRCDADDLARVLPRAGSPTTRSRATCKLVGRVPDDRHRQGAEVQDARPGHRRAGSGRLRGGPHRVSGAEVGLALSVLAACAVEAVEALTIVLAVGAGPALALRAPGHGRRAAALAVTVAALGPAPRRCPAAGAAAGRRRPAARLRAAVAAQGDAARHRTQGPA